MNSFFCSIGKDLAEKIGQAPNPLLAGDYEINKHKTTFRFKTIEVREIRDAFGTVKTAKSFGTANISSYFLMLALPFIENSLALLFNMFALLKQIVFLTHGKLLESLQFSKMEIRLISLTIDQCQSSLSSQGSLRSW